MRTATESTRAAALRAHATSLRLVKIDMLQLAAGLAQMGTQFDALRERLTLWAETVQRAERALGKEAAG